MTEVRNKGNYEQWIRFFLQALYECAADGIATIDKLAALYEKNEAAIQAMPRGAKNILSVFHYLEANPINDIGKTAEATGLSFNTVATAVKKTYRYEYFNTDNRCCPQPNLCLYRLSGPAAGGDVIPYADNRSPKSPSQEEGTLCQVFSGSLYFTACKPVLSKLPISIPLIKKDQARKPAPRLD